MPNLWQIELFSNDEVCILDVVEGASEAVSNAAAYMGFTRHSLDYDANISYLLDKGELLMEHGGWKNGRHYHETILIKEWEDEQHTE